MAENHTQDLNKMEQLNINSSQDKQQDNSSQVSTGAPRNNFRNDQNRQTNRNNNFKKPRQNRPHQNERRQNPVDESYGNLPTNEFSSNNEQREVNAFVQFFIHTKLNHLY